jgi:hypothetical protein
MNIDDILRERETRYGDFLDHACITQGIKLAIFRAADLDKLKCDHKEALEMIAHKIGRIINGDPEYADNWDDIAGYAKLVSDRIRASRT